ncbi:DUF742 domain-containing protein [Streptomyces sp. AV19]|uniref:DUF742 domain-containing protein n=1 Tax=Streptomyces sp. AV19 TaxID=2793068 RepID=UPI0018FF035C|nr:DUF742 domain-containing protein [Streptomyces sp. AV19]MBH1935307.1 DUF742 domain-containing protein [Streptomyces sp. AV19]MDG4531192.1 DUF742 domain-containing protein [Streptomyces sp. AV19]
MSGPAGTAGAGPVRPYVITGGRTAPSRDSLALETLVMATGGSTFPPPDLTPEAAEILGLCVQLLSVAEVAAHLRQPVAVVKVLLGDLLDAGLVLTRPPVTAADRHDPSLLKEVLDGLRQL